MNNNTHIIEVFDTSNNDSISIEVTETELNQIYDDLRKLKEPISEVEFYQKYGEYRIVFFDEIKDDDDTYTIDDNVISLHLDIPTIKEHINKTLLNLAIAKDE